MDVYRPLRAAFFGYELLRFAALARLPAVLDLSGGIFPYPALAAPNTLFLLMSLFIWLRPGDYRVYIPLYGAGKILTVTVFGVWCVFAINGPAVTVPLMEPERLGALGGAFIFSAGDLLAFAGTLALMNRMNRAGRAELPVPAEGGG